MNNPCNIVNVSVVTSCVAARTRRRTALLDPGAGGNSHAPHLQNLQYAIVISHIVVSAMSEPPEQPNSGSRD
jgi:hypothetical protein